MLHSCYSSQKPTEQIGHMQLFGTFRTLCIDTFCTSKSTKVAYATMLVLLLWCRVQEVFCLAICLTPHASWGSNFETLKKIMDEGHQHGSWHSLTQNILSSLDSFRDPPAGKATASRCPSTRIPTSNPNAWKAERMQYVGKIMQIQFIQSSNFLQRTLNVGKGLGRGKPLGRKCHAWAWRFDFFAPESPSKVPTAEYLRPSKLFWRTVPNLMLRDVTQRYSNTEIIATYCNLLHLNESLNHRTKLRFTERLLALKSSCLQGFLKLLMVT